MNKYCVCQDTGYFPAKDIITGLFVQSPCMHCEKGEKLKNGNGEEKKERSKKFQVYAKTQPQNFCWRYWE